MLRRRDLGRFGELGEGGLQRGWVDDRAGLAGFGAGERAGGQAVGRLGVAVAVEGDEALEVVLVPPADGVEVDGWEGAVEEDGFAGVHLAQRVGGGELVALHGLGDAAAVVAVRRAGRGRRGRCSIG